MQHSTFVGVVTSACSTVTIAACLLIVPSLYFDVSNLHSEVMLDSRLFRVCFMPPQYGNLSRTMRIICGMSCSRCRAMLACVRSGKLYLMSVSSVHAMPPIAVQLALSAHPVSQASMAQTVSMDNRASRASHGHLFLPLRTIRFARQVIALISFLG